MSICLCLESKSEENCSMSIVKSFSVGDGDMFYIKHNSDNFTTIDCCYTDDDNRDANFAEIKNESAKKGITRFISTHPDGDHIKGISEFCNTVGIVNFYCVDNEATKVEETDSFKKYCELRNSKKAFLVYKGCKRKWMNISDEERGRAGINFLWPICENEDYKEALKKVKDGSGYNNISPIFTYSIENNAKFLWMGDMEHNFLEKIKNEVEWPKVDILFAPHHGRDSGKVSSDVLKKLNPHIIIIGEAPSEYLNYYTAYNTITQNSAGDIVFECDDDIVNIYVSNESYAYSTDFLEDKAKNNTSLGYYLGTFTPAAAQND